MSNFQPIKDGELPQGGTVLVYLVNGGSTLGVSPVFRKLVKFRGRWCVHDRGRIPVTRICRDFLTTYAA